MDTLRVFMRFWDLCNSQCTDIEQHLANVPGLVVGGSNDVANDGGAGSGIAGSDVVEGTRYQGGGALMYIFTASLV